MRINRLNRTGFQEITGVLLVLLSCSGCSLADALIDGVFLGVSEIVSSTFVGAMTG